MSKTISATLQALGVLHKDQVLTPGRWDFPNDKFNVLMVWQDRNKPIDKRLHVSVWDWRKQIRFEERRPSVIKRHRLIAELKAGKPTIAVQVHDKNRNSPTYDTMDHERKIAPSSERVIYLLDNTVLVDGDNQYVRVKHRFDSPQEARNYLEGDNA
jgi:hypothetical protein